VGYFDNVGGLIGGAPVWLAGKRVGGVESVRFGEIRDDLPAVEVVMQIEEAAQQRIRSDSVATIGTIGLLGDVYVEVSLGTSAGQALGDGGEIATVSPVDLNRLISRVGRSLDEISDLTMSLTRVINEFEREQGATKLADSVAALGNVVEEVVGGDGLLHSLIYDQYQGLGVMSLEQSMATLNSILGKIDRGEGTFGLMLNDPTLYEELKMLVGGAGRSTVVRALINLTTEDGDE
jgi:phospholipid/cholesterol/gamma-HCH transport system substrate-binding protein